MYISGLKPGWVNPLYKSYGSPFSGSCGSPDQAQKIQIDPGLFLYTVTNDCSIKEYQFIIVKLMHKLLTYVVL